mmetsp:Transcript_12919/g.27902  ORF Transcript_12919/g.27902 Transcript_12919/m.27902 type:complete len:83 (+) Transcript_12919:153-401(+)
MYALHSARSFFHQLLSARHRLLSPPSPTATKHPKNLNTLESKESVQKFNRQELEGGLGSESSPNGDESSPQTKDAVLLHRLY